MVVGLVTPHPAAFIIFSSGVDKRLALVCKVQDIRNSYHASTPPDNRARLMARKARQLGMLNTISFSPSAPSAFTFTATFGFLGKKAPCAPPHAHSHTPLLPHGRPCSR